MRGQKQGPRFCCLDCSLESSLPILLHLTRSRRWSVMLTRTVQQSAGESDQRQQLSQTLPQRQQSCLGQCPQTDSTASLMPHLASNLSTSICECMMAPWCLIWPLHAALQHSAPPADGAAGVICTEEEVSAPGCQLGSRTQRLGFQVGPAALH